jgi:hypothetical protein
MAAVPLKGEYGPTLGQLLAPHWHRAGGVARCLAIAVGIGLVGLGVTAVLTFQDAGISHGGRVPFSFKYKGLYSTAPDPGGYVKVARYAGGRLRDSFAVEPLLLPPYEGSVTGELPLYASGYIRALAARYAGFQLQGEGKTLLSEVLGYNVFYSVLVGGRRMYGRDLLLPAERPGVREGVEVVMLSSRTASLTTMVASTGVLQTPYRSFTLE